MKDLGPESFAGLLKAGTPLIDVRAPVEFNEGHIPGSINLPILNDEERHRVGLTYKLKGPAAAIELGNELVSGDIRRGRVDAWVKFLAKNPDAVLTCFRGGLRSQTTQSWLNEAGLERPLVGGGYKTLRTYLRAQLDTFETTPVTWIGGATGAGKSVVLREVAKFRPTLDLEAHARHRGSAFGALDRAQPTQIDFENTLAVNMLKGDVGAAGWVLEDEGGMIGRVALPLALVRLKHEAPLVVVEEDLDSRVRHTFDGYVGDLGEDELARASERYQGALGRIAKRLGGARYKEVEADLARAIRESREGAREAHKIWIEKLLGWYYDPLYLADLAKRARQIQFRGSRQEVIAYLEEF